MSVRSAPAELATEAAAKPAPDVLFLAWDCPWPAMFGGAVRALGLLTELSKYFEVELILLTPRPLTAEQEQALGALATRITCVPRRDRSPLGKLHMALRSIISGRPYHCSVTAAAFDDHPEVLQRIHDFQGVVYASYGHWGTLVHRRPAPNWILDQQHAAAHFWDVYSAHASNPFVKAAAKVNSYLARRHFTDVYAGIGRIVSVCEEDRQLTLSLAANAAVDVIENGIDCSYYVPATTAVETPPGILFLGAGDSRNATALDRFVRRILPQVRRGNGEVRLTVAGDFGSEARARFDGHPGIFFTGRVDDLRGVFAPQDVFVVPHADTHGSQLKVAQAMAMGMAIVSTANGIRGLPLVDGESVLLARDDEDFARCVGLLLDDAALRSRLGAAAREAAVTHLDWRALSKRLVTMIDGVAVSSGRWDADPDVDKGRRVEVAL